MRRTEKEIRKLRLKIIELKRDGKTYEEIRRITSASPSTIAKILKNFNGRYCVKCGETNPEVLEEHHPDKENYPDYTITLCANCHEQITREQLRQKNKKQKLNGNNLPDDNNKISDLSRGDEIQIIPIKTLNSTPVGNFNIKSYSTNITDISPTAILGIACLISGFLGLETAFDELRDKKERILFFLISCANFIGFYRIWTDSSKK